MFKLFDPVKECVFDLDFYVIFLKLRCDGLTFNAGYKRATDEGSLPEIAQYSQYYLPLPLNVFTASNGSNLYIFIYYFRFLFEELMVSESFNLLIL